MPSGWRIQKAQHAARAFSGEGARTWRGRWNSRGVPLVYLSEHQSLAVLEVFMRTRPFSFRTQYALLGAQWDESLVETFPRQRLPEDWRSLPQGADTAAIGDRWVREARSAVLAVPSAIIPAEINYLINPAHSDFRRMIIGSPEPFVFDPRLFYR